MPDLLRDLIEMHGMTATAAASFYYTLIRLYQMPRTPFFGGSRRFNYFDFLHFTLMATYIYYHFHDTYAKK